MGALRTRMIEKMKLKNFSPRTEQSYVSAMVGLVKYYRRSPDQLGFLVRKTQMLVSPFTVYRPFSHRCVG
ncbi:MAG: hypothetical protein HW419_1772 [Deltaproteobacteria bacterium]|nr:hypothetical protein [Deltaproteobacteria bacterium]